MLRKEKETMRQLTPDFNVENLQRDKKHPLCKIKTEYKVLPSSNQPILPRPLD